MKKVGIIGGGQVGKMMILDGRRLDTKFNILDPAFGCPAHAVSDLHIAADSEDIDAIRRLAACCDVLTCASDKISPEVLKIAGQEGVPVYPSGRTLELIRDRYVQKDWMRRNGIPVPEFLRADTPEEIEAAGKRFGYPFLLKARSGGHDGKGNYVVRSAEDIAEGWETLGSGKVPLMAEEWVDFEKEISVPVCRGINGEIKTFPAAETVRMNNIPDETTAPARIGSEPVHAAMLIAEHCVNAFEACGTMCVEFFVEKSGRVLVSRLVPQPHDSGNYTIEACVTSQYEQHVRAVLGYPLGDTSLVRPAAVKNIIGDHEGHAFVHGLEKACALPGVKVHIYGKTEVRKGRRMGHITATADTAEEALRLVREAHKFIYFTDAENDLERIIKS